MLSLCMRFSISLDLSLYTFCFSSFLSLPSLLSLYPSLFYLYPFISHHLPLNQFLFVPLSNQSLLFSVYPRLFLLIFLCSFFFFFWFQIISLSIYILHRLFSISFSLSDFLSLYPFSFSSVLPSISSCLSV